MMPAASAEQRTRFFDTYRSYVINYNLGKDLVKQYVESRGGARRSRRSGWQEFVKLLASPRLPSALRATAQPRADGSHAGGVAPGAELHATFGEIDIYLFDQLLRGRFDRRRRILDAGCGDGRNLPYFLSRGFDCFGVDRDPSAVARVRRPRGTPRSASLRRSLSHRRARRSAVGRGDHGRRDLQRRPAFFVGRRAFRTDGAGDVAGARAGGVVLRAARVQHRSRRPRLARPAAAPVFPTAPTASSSTSRCCMEWTDRLGGRAARSDQDHERAAAALHDDVVCRERRGVADALREDARHFEARFKGDQSVTIIRRAARRRSSDPRRDRRRS